MAPTIHLLPRDVAERIAAGEVIERPAAVVRELVDNAIDARAREITVEIRGGGLELIRVADDGVGIPADQVELAFQRHATSKITTLDDLGRLHTLGFRGEALASIAAISEVTLLTHAADEPTGLGTQVVLRGGEVERRGHAARLPGTTVSVRHLFHNVPARLKFMAGGRGETSLIGQLLRRYALAHPDLRFTLSLDGRPSFHTNGQGTLEGALGDVYGEVVAESLLPLPETHAGSATLTGFISGHALTRPSRQHVTLFTNGRWAASRGLLAALEAAYRALLPRGRHPIAAIFLDVPPAEVDANVHPAKTEVKLLHEDDVAEALAQTVRDTLGRSPARPSLSTSFALSDLQFALPSPRHRLAETPGGWDADHAEPHAIVLGDARVLAQVHDTFILAEGASGLVLVDQHRAHERVIYEVLLARERDAAPGQALLEPVVLELKPHQAALLDARLNDLEALGFACQRFGGREYLVRAIPQLPGSREDLAASLPELLELAAFEDDTWRGRLLAQLACRAALRRNQPLAEHEMTRLMHELAETHAPAVCPHGSPLILHFSGAFLRRQLRL